MQAIVMCAGMGTRLGGRTQGIPKTLVELNGRPILSYIWASLQASPVDEVILVGGYEVGRLGDFAAGLSGKPVKVVFNPEFRLGSILTVQAALPLIRGSFVVMNGDHIHPAEMMKKLLAAPKDLTCACDRDRSLGDDDMKVALTPDGRVAAMDKKLTRFDCGYIGMTVVPEARLERYGQYATLTRERFGDAANVERIIHCLAEDGFHSDICDLSGFGWIEVDNEADLLQARQTVLTNQFLKFL